MRRIATPLVAFVALASLALAGCGGASAPALDDPIDILVKSVETLEDAKSVHLELTLDGELPLDLAGGLLPGASGGSGGSGGTIDVGGTTVKGDADIEGEAVQLTFAVPALLNTTGEVILVDDALFLKTSLTGDKYQVFDGLDSGGILPGEPSPDGSASPTATDPAEDLRSKLEELETPPVKLPDEKCGDTDCYRVQVKLDSADAGSLASIAPDITGQATVDVWVRKNDLRPAQLTITASAGDEGNLTATLVLSGWDASVDIKAPPEDQVEEGSFDFPGMDSPSPTP